MDGNGCSIGTHILSYKPQNVCPISPKDDDSNTDDDTTTGIDGSMDDSDSK